MRTLIVEMTNQFNQLETYLTKDSKALKDLSFKGMDTKQLVSLGTTSFWDGCDYYTVTFMAAGTFTVNYSGVS